MDNSHTYLGIIGGVLSLAAYVPYIVSVIKGETNPVRASWITWTLGTLIILLSSYSLGVRETIWVPLAYLIGCSTVTLISFKFGSRGWSKFDKFCLLGVVLSIIVWYISENAVLALLMNIFIDFLGYLPTLKKLFQERGEQEDVTAWCLHFFGTLANVLALSVWNVEAVYPVVLFTLNTSTLALALRNRLGR